MLNINNKAFWSVLALVDLWLGMTLIMSFAETCIPWITGEWTGFSEYYFTLCVYSNIGSCFNWACQLFTIGIILKLIVINKD